MILTLNDTERKILLLALPIISTLIEEGESFPLPMNDGQCQKTIKDLYDRINAEKIISDAYQIPSELDNPQQPPIEIDEDEDNDSGGYKL